MAVRLADSLHIAPAERELFLQVARSERSVDHLPPPIAAAVVPDVPAAPRLPTPLTSFVGRARARLELEALVRQQRLVSLVGMGGAGKTRLALEVARQLEAEFTHGVRLIELAPLHDPDVVLPTIAQAFDLREDGHTPLLTTLVAKLRDLHMLLIFDNCEHLIDACAQWIPTLLEQCPRLHGMATSREALRVAGEQLYPLAPLDLPPEEANTPLAQVAECEAVQLFCARAQLMQPGFALAADNVAAVVAICRRLDGLPLALELAAARMRWYAPQVIAQQIDEPLSALVDGARNIPARQQTLRSMIDWSYSILEPSERELWECLGLFAASWSLAAATALYAKGSTPLQVATLLNTLSDKQLVVPLLSADEPRFTMLETLRAYVQEHFTQRADQLSVRQRYADFYQQLVRTAAAQLNGPDGELAMAQLSQEYANIRGLLEWCFAAADHWPQLAADLCVNLWTFWWKRGDLSEGRRWLALALQAVPESAEEQRGWLLQGSGVLARAQGDTDAAIELLRESLFIWRGLDDPQGMARTLNSLGVVLFNQRRYAEAERLFTESFELHRYLNDLDRAAMALNNLGNIAYKQQNLDRATALYTQALELLADAAEHRSTLILIKTNLGELARLRGDINAAAQLFVDSLHYYHAVQDREGILFCLNNFVELALDCQQGQLAAKLLGCIETELETIDAKRSIEQEEVYQRQLLQLSQLLSAEQIRQTSQVGARLGVTDLLPLIQHDLFSGGFHAR